MAHASGWSVPRTRSMCRAELPQGVEKQHRSASCPCRTRFLFQGQFRGRLCEVTGPDRPHRGPCPLRCLLHALRLRLTRCFLDTQWDCGELSPASSSLRQGLSHLFEAPMGTRVELDKGKTQGEGRGILVPSGRILGARLSYS